MIGSYFGVDVPEIIARLDELDPQEITLLIESPGGTVSAGLALYSDLMARQKDKGVVVKAEARGVVASSAVLPFLAASERSMRDGSELMVHGPWTMLFLVGDVRKVKKDYQRIENGLLAAEERYKSILTQRSGQTEETVAEWLLTDTWFQPQSAIDHGLATTAEELADEDQSESALAQNELESELMMKLMLEAGA